MGKTLLLIDGHALAFREYYALERTNMSTTDGTPTWAVYGFFKAIFDLLKNKKIKPDAICVAFDVSHQTFRVEEYSEYKSNREAMPDNMQSQMELIYEGLKAFDIPVYTKEGFEADDVIGTIAKKACALGNKVYILTGDQDSFQLIDKNACVSVIIPTKGQLVQYDWNKVYEKLGVYPDQIIDYKSLRGDTSDNIPGVKGIGEKTAVKLLSEYGHLDNILKNCDNIKPDGIKKRLCDDIEMAKLSYKLATIVTDVDIDFDFNSAKLVVPEVSKVTDFLRKLQLYSFIKNIDEILSTFDKDNKAKESPQDITEPLIVQDNGQLGLFAQAVKEEVNKIEFNSNLNTINNLEQLEQAKNVLLSKKLIAYAFKADHNNTWLVMSYNDGIQSLENITDNFSKTICYAINLALTGVFNSLKPIFESKDLSKITHDAKISYEILKKKGIELKGIVFDTLLASYVKDASRNHSIDIQSLEYINHVMDATLDKSITPEYMQDYSTTILELTKYWVSNLDKNELKLLIDVEIPLSIVLGKMELTGVSVDSNYLKQLSIEMNKELSNLQDKIYEISGEPFNINSPKQVADIIYDKLQLKPTKKRGKKSTSAEVLEDLAQEYEIAKLILEYRKFSKLKSTYTDALQELVDKKDNRIHTTYNQTTTVTGRLSSSNPNLQNIPVRTPEGSKIRKAFIAQNREDSLILSADYSQIELRLLAHITQDKNLTNAFNSGVDVHTLTASKVFSVPINDVTKQMRYSAKAVNFGIVYGQSKYGLAKVLGITPSEAEDFINKYFETYPNIRDYMEEIVNFALENGYVETIFGRKRYLAAELNNSNGMIREFAKRAAINHPMQGSAADLIKIAMVDFDKKISEGKYKSKLIMQVHDELIVEADRTEEENITSLLIKSMELGQPLNVPLVVDVSKGDTW